MTVLKTLDLRMANQLHINIFRIHQDLAMRIDGAQDRIIDVIENMREDIMEQFRTGTTTIASSSRSPPKAFSIPTSLESLFEQEAQISSDSDQFPLVRGLDAVVYHLNAANTIGADIKDTKKERQWLAIAKALWTIGRVKDGQEYKDACSLRPSNDFEMQMKSWGITVASYVKGLEIELLEIIKTSDINSITPDPEALIQTFQANPEIWLEVKCAMEAKPTWELSYSENIMEASLRGPFRGFDQTIQLFRLTSIDLKLVIIDTPRPGTVGEKTNTIIPVDMRRSHLIPLYATSISATRDSPLNIAFQGDRLASGSSALVFNKRTELFKFQHAITGYQVVLESIGIGAVTYSANKMMGGSKSEYSGRLQLWRAKKPQNNPSKDSVTTAGDSSSSTGSGASQSTIMAPISPSTTLSSSPPSQGSLFSSTRSKRDSTLTATSTASTLSIPKSRFGTSDRRNSTFTVRSTGTSSGLSLSPKSYTTSIVSSNGTVGVVLEKPEPSLLVLLLQCPPGSSSRKAPNTPSFSSLAIEIDENTAIDPSACKCRKDPDNCLRIVLQSKGKVLGSFRQDAATLEAWNLAALGKDQKKELIDSKERLSWVAVDFGTMGDKFDFEKTFKSLWILWGREKEEYRRILRGLRDQAV